MERMVQRTVQKVLRTVANYDPDYYDMYADPAEALFAQLYLARIRRHADQAGIASGARVLDVGCQAGRLAIPLAQDGFRVTGVDRSGFALRRAAQNARTAGAAVTWVRGDILQTLPRQPGPYDIIVCAEVLYLCQNYREILRALAGVLRPGGLAFVSHRPKAYYLSEAVQRSAPRIAATVAQAGEGCFLPEGAYTEAGYFNWQTDAELRQLYRDAGLAWQVAYPIDAYAWPGGQSPAAMTPAEQAAWLAKELAAPAEASLPSRYVLVVAAKPQP